MAFRWRWCGTAIILLLRCNVVEAWGVEGHERIARVADGLLTGKHKDQIRTMMHGGLVDLADIEKKMTEKYPDSNLLHWHRQDPEWECGKKGGIGDGTGHMRCDQHGADKGSLFCALAYFFEHFAHDLLLNEFPTPKYPVETPKFLKGLEKVAIEDLKSSDYLRWLAILIGDLHQPLHWLQQHGYGQDIQVEWRGERQSLKQFWEEYLPNHLKKNEGAVHPDMTDKEYAGQAEAWHDQIPTELFRIWGTEEAETVCTEVYKPMTVNHQDGTRVESPYNLTQDVFDTWEKLAERLLTTAGERLAFVLNDILEHKRHKDAAKDGRGLPSIKSVSTEVVAVGGGADGGVAPSKVGATGDGKTHKHIKNFGDLTKRLKILERRRTRSSAKYNALIAVFLVPCLLLALNFHRTVGGGSLFCMAKHIKM